MKSDFEAKMLKLLEESKIVDHIVMSDVLDDIDTLIVKLF